MTIEYDQDLSAGAIDAIARTGYADRVEVRCGDGALEAPDRAPYDAIIVTVGLAESMLSRPSWQHWTGLIFGSTPNSVRHLDLWLATQQPIPFGRLSPSGNVREAGIGAHGPNAEQLGVELLELTRTWHSGRRLDRISRTVQWVTPRSR